MPTEQTKNQKAALGLTGAINELLGICIRCALISLIMTYVAMQVIRANDQVIILAPISVTK